MKNWSKAIVLLFVLFCGVIIGVYTNFYGLEKGYAVINIRNSHLLLRVIELNEVGDKENIQLILAGSVYDKISRLEHTYKQFGDIKLQVRGKVWGLNDIIENIKQRINKHQKPKG